MAAAARQIAPPPQALLIRAAATEAPNNQKVKLACSNGNFLTMAPEKTNL